MIPDKIYIRPQTNPNMLGGIWSGKSTKEATVPYIRKDALLKWLEERINDGDEEGLMTNQIANLAYKDVIEKLNNF